MKPIRCLFGTHNHYRTERRETPAPTECPEDPTCNVTGHAYAPGSRIVQDVDVCVKCGHEKRNGVRSWVLAPGATLSPPPPEPKIRSLTL